MIIVTPSLSKSSVFKMGKIYATIDSWQELFVTPTSPTFAFLAMN